jgi:hypothetical protein
MHRTGLRPQPGADIIVDQSQRPERHRQFPIRCAGRRKSKMVNNVIANCCDKEEKVLEACLFLLVSLYLMATALTWL